jgi:hypothetical protein
LIIDARLQDLEIMHMSELQAFEIERAMEAQRAAEARRAEIKKVESKKAEKKQAPQR